MNNIEISVLYKMLHVLEQNKLNLTLYEFMDLERGVRVLKRVLEEEESKKEVS